MPKVFFDEHAFDLVAAECELAEFDLLLTTNTDLAERRQVLASFKTWPNLCALMGQYNPLVGTGNLIKLELKIPPHFRTDLTVRKKGTDNLCLVEFEGASDRHIFKPSEERGAEAWSPAFEAGFSQVVDWTWAFDHYRTNKDYLDAFGSERPNIHGVLVIGRATAISASSVGEDRWLWRSRKVKVDGLTLTLQTFDELYNRLAEWIAEKKTP
ncbi:Shedu anti-phage system protein SduA domain-containing protein [Methylobacterium sp. WL9]|uniref:Shedu anti-phage system protein SduA domain-containing protein n=1 Tax=Methylobacterium sp. WL9 TaxID=2603898 RepID=UPI0011C79E01|nr:Shedu anti-phage system protein SduA domain-containing protein [Methylobacterium sp. WL9]TXN23577.1 DUF4263 domain-containing protein [Methylobacterium sp. WL9]